MGEDLIEKFRVGHIGYNGISAGRADEQCKVLRAFADHAGKSLLDCEATDLKAYLTHLLESGLHPNTVQKKANMIRPFYGWAFDEGLVSGDTLMAMRRVQKPQGATKKTRPNPYSRKELRQFWADLDERWPYASANSLKRWENGTSSWQRVWRHAMRLQIEAIVRLALDCGLRRQEIYGLREEDVHGDNFYVAVIDRREGNGTAKYQPREVPFTTAAREAVNRWLKFRRSLKPETDQLWLSLWAHRRDKPMRWSRFDKIMRTVGDYGLHRFRHTCATEMLRAGVPLESVQRILGHSRIQQTLAYAELLTEDIHKAVAKAETKFEEAVRG